MSTASTSTSTTPRGRKPSRPGGRTSGKDVPGITRPMTYEEYLAGSEEVARYDVIDGWKVYRVYGVKRLPNPTIEHQDIVFNIAEAFRAFQRREKTGRAILAPCDVLVTRRPLRTRQPDVLFISNDRFGDRSRTEAAPLSPAPELVVEVISPSDKPSVLAAKIADYRAVDVREVWVVRSSDQTVEVIELTIDEIRPVRTYASGETVASLAFPGLSVPTDDIFAVE